jgi:hypothetical protein
MLLRPGTSLSSHFRYALPQVVSAVNGHQQYRLQVLRQAGSQARTLTIEIALPSGARLIGTNVAASQSGQSVLIETTLDADETFTVDYEAP